MMEKPQEGSSGAASAGPSGSRSSGRNSSQSIKSSSDETEKGEDDTSSNKDEEENDCFPSSEDVPNDKGDPAIAVPVIPLIERAEDGTLIQRALLCTDAFWGYGSLARLVRQFSPYDPPDSLVHILWPWVGHTTVYFGADERVLNPRGRWEDFASKLKEVHMLPMGVSRPALCYLHRIPINIPGLPPLDLRPYYWLRFQQPPTPERVVVIRRSAIRSYRSFFWIINGLWASWRDREPMNAEEITEANVVQEGYDFVLARSNRIKFFDEYGKRLKLPKFLVACKQLEGQRRGTMELNASLDEEDDTDTTEDESSVEDEKSDEENYPDDVNYESIWDFLTQVLEVVIPWSYWPTHHVPFCISFTSFLILLII